MAALQAVESGHALSHHIVGGCAAIQALVGRLPTVAKARRTTLITGPTGSGKEVVAAALHRQAFSGSAPYVPVHCGALPEQLVEAELFGHTRGAFTGAVQARVGLIKTAADGTLFLDEIDSLSLSVQAKMLRFLETGEFRQVGSDRIERSAVWVLAASNKNLHEEVKHGRFREDLLYRLDVIHLQVPPLRLRGGDVELLARHFLARFGGDRRQFTLRAIAAMHAYDWPGNVRELKHRIERAVLMSESAEIDVEDLELDELSADNVSASQCQQGALNGLWQLIERGLSLSEAIARCEQALITAALESERGNRTRAARRLGIHVRTIFKKLNQ